jgi:hypothetical protein
MGVNIKMDIKEIWQERVWNLMGQDVIQGWVIVDTALNTFGFHRRQVISRLLSECRLLNEGSSA